MLGRELLAPEEEQRDVARPRLVEVERRARARARPRRRPSCRSRRARAPRRRRSGPGGCPAPGPCRSAPRARRAGRPARRGRHEEERLVAGVLGRPTRPARAPSRCSRIAASCRLSDGMSTSSSVRAARRSASAVTAGAYRGIISAVTARQPDPAPGAEPERGFLVAVLPEGRRRRATSSRELRELARTAGVEPVGELVQHRARPDPRTYVGKGKLEELKQAFGDARRRGAPRRRRARARRSSGRSRTRSRRASSTARS